MKELFVSYEVALALKEKGFNDLCFAKFNKKSFQLNSLGGGQDYNSGKFGINLISAPMYQQVINWLDNTHSIMIRKSLEGGYKIYLWYDGKRIENDWGNTINELILKSLKLI